jgi:hypothetical protein
VLLDVTTRMLIDGSRSRFVVVVRICPRSGTYLLAPAAFAVHCPGYTL